MTVSYGSECIPKIIYCSSLIIWELSSQPFSFCLPKHRGPLKLPFYSAQTTDVWLTFIGLCLKHSTIEYGSAPEVSNLKHLYRNPDNITVIK